MTEDELVAALEWTRAREADPEPAAPAYAGSQQSAEAAYYGHLRLHEQWMVRTAERHAVRALLDAARLIRKNEWILAEAGDDRWICGACDGAVYSGDGEPREDWYEHHDHDCAIGMWVRAAGRAAL